MQFYDMSEQTLANSTKIRCMAKQLVQYTVERLVKLDKYDLSYDLAVLLRLPTSYRRSILFWRKMVVFTVNVNM